MAATYHVIKQSSGIQFTKLVGQNSGNQTSTNSYAAHAASVLDTIWNPTVAMTMKVATNAVKWIVYGANLEDFSDKVELQAEAVINAGAIGSYSGTALYRYIRAEIASNVPDTHGVATVNVVSR